MSTTTMTNDSTVLKNKFGYKYYESNGDYEQDASQYFELNEKNLPLYRNQKKLPHLPVPTLEDTAKRLLGSSLPLARNEEEAESFRRVVQDFPREALNLQEKLIHYAKTRQNWMQHWWNLYAYLKVRDPVVINVSFQFNLPKDFTVSNAIQRGASVLMTTLQHCQKIESGQFDPDIIRLKRKNNMEIPLCSSGYRYMFHSCRIPQLNQDSYRIYKINSPNRHVVVAVGGQFFKITLPKQQENTSIQSLEKALQECIRQAHHDNNDFGYKFPLGYLTTANRDDWANDRNILVRDYDGMEQALESLQSAMMILSLDIDENKDMDNTPVYSQRQRAKHYLCGASPNRWYDKSCQFICTPNGDLGLVGEHSMMDGMPYLSLVQQLKQNTYQKQCEKQENENTSNTTMIEIQNIFQPVLKNLDETQKNQLSKMIFTAKQNYNDRREELQVQCLSFHGYGSNWLKQYCSPDALVQMALQLTSYRSFDRQLQATYESAQVRQFIYGRTETTRSVSMDSMAFVRAMGMQPHHSNVAEEETKFHLLRRAMKSHSEYTKNATRGQGVDRHLMGLSMIAAEDDTPLPSLFSHPLLVRSKQWVLSTSTLPDTNPGFGPVVLPHGLGIAYDIRPNHIYFTITAYEPSDRAETFKQRLEDALLELQPILQYDEPSKDKDDTPKSRL